MSIWKDISVARGMCMKYLSLVFISIFMIGCAQKEHMSFTSDMPAKYALDDFDMKNIQFYTSHDITLYRDNSINSASVVDGTLVVNKKEHSNILKIKAGTPCVVVCSNEKLIRVSFENDIELTFLKRENCHQKNQVSKYYLAANIVKDNRATVEIHGETYIVQNKSGQSYLTIDKEFLTDTHQEASLVEGRKVANN